jgi:hypothetical protein
VDRGAALSELDPQEVNVNHLHRALEQHARREYTWALFGSRGPSDVFEPSFLPFALGLGPTKGGGILGIGARF